MEDKSMDRDITMGFKAREYRQRECSVVLFGQAREVVAVGEVEGKEGPSCLDVLVWAVDGHQGR